MKSLRTFGLCFAMMVFIAAGTTIAQNNFKQVPQLKNYYSIGSDPATLIKTSVPQNKKMSAAEKELLRELQDARMSNNKTLKAKLENKFFKMHDITPVEMVPKGPIPVLTNTPHSSTPPFEGDYMTTRIAITGAWSIATATVPVGAPNAGRIWAAWAGYSSTQTDTIRIAYSDNGGASWDIYSGFYYVGNYNQNYRPNELDIEIVYDGTSVWLFGVAGMVNPTGQLRCNFFRFNTTTFSFFSTFLTWPGQVTDNKYYNPRITSDNSVYTGASYVYIIASIDTADASSGRHCKAKYAYLTSPFATTPTIAYPQANSNGGFWWHSGVPANSYFYNDIAYFRFGTTDRIIVVSNFPTTVAFPSMYLAWSDNYGVSHTGALTLTENTSNVTYGARIAFNGGTGNEHGMITYTRLYNGIDWDPYYRVTSNGGATTGSWTSGYINSSTARARYTDVIAVRGAAGLFKSGYIQDVTGGRMAYYTGWGGSSWNQPSSLIVNNIVPDSTYGKIRAGYKNGGGDNCFAVWSGNNGANVYASRLCLTTTGISNNNTPVTYSLRQNYPNPFNPTTSIRYSVPVNSLVKLIVYDVLGKQVSVLVNEIKSPGSYVASFDASNLPSGAYFYKMEAGDFTSVKKMVLIK